MYTYDVISESVRNPHELAAELTRRSEQGWEVVHIAYDGSAWFHAFIRHEGNVGTAPHPVASASVGSPTASASADSAWQPATSAASSDVGFASAAPAASTAPAANAQPTGTPNVPAMWAKDPSGRFELRYWNGSKWTEHVSTGGRQSIDPPTK